MRTPYALTILGFLLASASSAQYCSPAVINDCWIWRATNINVGGLNWIAGDLLDCDISDFTAQSATVVAGEGTPMTVLNYQWCGCAVWVDLDNSASFEDSENLFHEYADDSAATYQFDLLVPSATPVGSYRMRVLAGWATDCYTDTFPSGYGACGTYDYGSFQDFTLQVTDGVGVEETTGSPFSMSPNPSNDAVTISGLSSKTSVEVLDATGRLLEQHIAQGDRLVLDLSDRVAGLYFVHVDGTAQRLVVR